jgi:hypothetical protein
MGSPGHRDAEIIPLRTPALVAWEVVQGVRASFPAWHIWYSDFSETWNAHRKGLEPWFGPVPDGAPIFMVSGSTAAALVVELEGQTLADLVREFPSWQIRRTKSGGWGAFSRTASGVQLVHGTTAAPLAETLRAIHQYQRRCAEALA